jgi:ADP-heptose:LPS heptosyltransferase
MPERRRWTPVKGTRNRVADPRERLLLRAIDPPLRLLSGLLDLASPRAAVPAEVRQVLVLRLDRIGDVLMSLPALADLRAALPRARIRLAVGRWSEEVARSAPVDEVLVWSVPWAGRPHEGSERLGALMRKARSLRPLRLDLAVDLQGDIRSAMLMRLTGARRRVGYANTGGAYLLTDVVPLDETVSWVEQNRRAVTAALGPLERAALPPLLTEADRDFVRRLFGSLRLQKRRPLVGIHPSGGRAVKQWDIRSWSMVASRLQQELGATVLLTGSSADQPLAAALARGLSAKPIDLTGRLGLRETLAVIAELDLFLSPDTGPMHMACAVGTPCVSVFGPSDPVRYFSGGDPKPGGAPGSRHVVVRAELWCSPCNLIRRPPAECSGPEPPECLRLVSPEEVHAHAARLLREVGGYEPRGGA